MQSPWAKFSLPGDTAAYARGDTPEFRRSLRQIFGPLVERVAECPERLRYDLPEEWRPRLWGGRWKGQLQDWYLCRFLGTDSDVHIATAHPEFADWKWIDAAHLPDIIVPFKRNLYRRILSEFAGYL